MNKRLATVCWVMLAVLSLANVSLAGEMNIMTGSEKGTYYQFGLNLQQLVKPKGIELGVLPSSGSIENLYAVFKKPKTQLGIVQSDVLAFVSKVQSNPTLTRIAEKTRMVFPLYNEEIHILGRKDISDFDGLEGMRVAIGEDGSGTYLSARLLFEVSGIKPKEMVMVGTNEALTRLKAKQIDAMFYVAGSPVKLFSEGVSGDDQLALIPNTNKKVSEFYQGAKIPAGTYPWQPSEVDTVAVKAVLVSYDFKYQGCEAIAQFSRVLQENIGWLRENGHPKWKSVDLEYNLKGWEQYGCARKYLVKNPASSPQSVAARPAEEINPIMNAVKEMLNR
jgi:TRAP transporter TAXI family solute receptor